MSKTGLTITAVSLALLFPLSASVYAGDAKLGKEKATQCASCHGVNGEGNGTPKSKLAGMDVKTFTKNINDFKSGARKNAMMEMFAKNLSDEDIANLAAYFATK